MMKKKKKTKVKVKMAKRKNKKKKYSVKKSRQRYFEPKFRVLTRRSFQIIARRFRELSSRNKNKRKLKLLVFRAIRETKEYRRNMFKPIYLRMYRVIRADFKRAIKKPKAKKESIDFTIDVYASRHTASLITNIDRTTRNKLRRLLTEELLSDDGVNRDFLENEISRLVTETYSGRAFTIARTEVHNTIQNAGLISAKENEMKYKEWSHSPSLNERYWHKDTNGQTKKIDQKFNVAGASMNGPGDSAGGALNTVNCSCTLFFTTRKN